MVVTYTKSARRPILLVPEKIVDSTGKPVAFCGQQMFPFDQSLSVSWGRVLEAIYTLKKFVILKAEGTLCFAVLPCRNYWNLQAHVADVDFNDDLEIPTQVFEVKTSDFFRNQAQFMDRIDSGHVLNLEDKAIVLSCNVYDEVVVDDIQEVLFEDS